MNLICRRFSPPGSRLDPKRGDRVYGPEAIDEDSLRTPIFHDQPRSDATRRIGPRVVQFHVDPSLLPRADRRVGRPNAAEGECEPLAQLSPIEIHASCPTSSRARCSNAQHHVASTPARGAANGGRAGRRVSCIPAVQAGGRLLEVDSAQSVPEAHLGVSKGAVEHGSQRAVSFPVRGVHRCLGCLSEGILYHGAKQKRKSENLVGQVENESTICCLTSAEAEGR